MQDARLLAKKIVGYSVLVRKSEQSLNPESVVTLAVLFLLVFFYFSRVDARMERAAQKQAAFQTKIAQGGSAYDLNALGQIEVTPNFPLTATPSPVPTLTMTPSPTATVGAVTELVFLKLSFYDPNIGSVIPSIADINCANFDHVNGVCVSTMANGVPFGQYYGRAVACPPPMQNGDMLEVIYPVQLAGQWVCMDRGWAIEYPYIDFLLRYPDMVWTGYNLNNFPWSSTVQARWTHP